MGVEYSARILVGLPYGDVQDLVDSVKDPYDCGLEVVHPYFDADYEDCLFGVLVKNCGDFSYSQIDEFTWTEKVHKAHEEFTKKTGKKGILYLSTYGS